VTRQEPPNCGAKERHREDEEELYEQRCEDDGGA